MSYCQCVLCVHVLGVRLIFVCKGAFGASRCIVWDYIRVQQFRTIIE